MTIALVIRRLGVGDADKLEEVAPDLFDNPIDPRLTAEFLSDPRHHLFAALDDDVVVGFVSGVHYVHPDKRAQMFINEVSTAATHRRRGIARSLLEALLDHARGLGCSEAWVLTASDNLPARRLYGAGGCVGDPALMFTFALDQA